jgi:hypothetical protein
MTSIERDSCVASSLGSAISASVFRRWIRRMGRIASCAVINALNAIVRAPNERVTARLSELVEPSDVEPATNKRDRPSGGATPPPSRLRLCRDRRPAQQHEHGGWQPVDTQRPAVAACSARKRDDGAAEGCDLGGRRRAVWAREGEPVRRICHCGFLAFTENQLGETVGHPRFKEERNPNRVA